MILYNEIDPVACAVLRATGHGYVDERDIRLVQPMDVWGYRRVHWFGGAGIWEVAARMAGWPLERELWTASCPCQGESVAGKRLGALDPRDLWPDFFPLIRACRPACVVGENVDAAIGSHWLDRTALDMENAGYAFRAVDIPAASVDSPHRRNRLYWVAVADADSRRCAQQPQRDSEPFSWIEASRRDDTFRCTMADANSGGRRRRSQDALGREKRRDAAERADALLEHSTDWSRREAGEFQGEKRCVGPESSEGRFRRSLTGSNSRSFWWDDSEWLRCADGKARRAQSCLRDVADGVLAGTDDRHPEYDAHNLLVPSFPGRTEAWRLAGNAIVPQLAAQVLMALLDVLDDPTVKDTT